MDWATIGAIATVAATVLAAVLHFLGILEKIAGWARGAWDSLRGKSAAVPLPPQRFPLEPLSQFKLLPQHYSVELSAQLPYVEASFFVVNFLSRAITLTEVKLSLRLLGASPIEAIPLVLHDFRIEPKDTPIVVCRRNLSDSELRNLPWRAGRESGSFELVAKAMDDNKTLSYGPVSSRFIEGWINGVVKGKSGA